MDLINVDKDQYKTSRILYIIEAALEYFISIAVGGVYLAKMTAYIGFSDAVTGILSSFVSLGCGFQIFAIFLSKYKPVKRWVTALHIISQTMFAMLYLIPVMKISKLAKTILFISSLLIAQIMHNIINAPKINWFMSLVDNGKRGKFTANKEMVSLVGGMIVSYSLGMLIDYYSDKGQIKTAFILCGIGLVVLMFLHSLTLIFSKEKPCERQVEITPLSQLKGLLNNKNILKIVLVATMWNIANHIVVPFLGTYQTKELGFSIAFASLVTIAGSFARVICSKPFGAYADKHGFSRILIICFVIEITAFTVCALAVPTNGKVIYPIYYILYCVGQAGINSSFINLIYDYVEESQRTSALAINQTSYGLAGFFTTLIFSPLVSSIQNKGNSFFGKTVYAQQVFAVISALVTVVLLIYVIKVINKMERTK